MINDIQKQILKLKEENDVCILAHSYMAQEIKEIADFTGDSYALAVKSAKVPQKTVIMCGVRFMAETVKILAPEKKVILSNPDAGCPMAEQMDKETISLVKEQYPDYAVVAYINTTASLKTICDVCVTSSSAVEICKKLDADKILFIPESTEGVAAGQTTAVSRTFPVPSTTATAPTLWAFFTISCTSFFSPSTLETWVTATILVRSVILVAISS